MGAPVKIGDRFTHLVVLGFTRSSKLFSKRRGVYCQCDCGNLVCTLAQSLRRGATRSCGCYGARQRNKGKRYLECDSSMKNRSKVYVRWFNMLHSKRGVVDAWEDYSVFKAWWFEQGYDDGPRLYMKPIDKHKPYGPDNVIVRRYKEPAHDAKPKGSWKSPAVLVQAVREAYKTCKSTRVLAERFVLSRNTVCTMIEGVEK